MILIQDKPRSVDLDEFLSNPFVAHLATTSKNERRESPVWFLWEEQSVWRIGNKENTFPTRIAQDPRCSIGVVNFDRKSGLFQHVGFRGKATVEPFDKRRARRLLVRYLGNREEAWDPRFRETLDDSTNILIKFVPETAVARDVSYRQSVE